MIQFLADQIDQLDLALDQLAIRDRNFDRFAMMLIDNVVELTLNEYAWEQRIERNASRSSISPSSDPNFKMLFEALGRRFDAKVKYAKHMGLVSLQTAETIAYLHEYRNSVYHVGNRHEDILRSLALFYLVNCCDILANFSPLVWTSSSEDVFSHRAVKYLGNPSRIDPKVAFSGAWDRLRAVGISMGNTLVRDLHLHMQSIILEIDEEITLVIESSLHSTSRDEFIVDAQAWLLLDSDDGRKAIEANGLVGKSPLECIKWFIKNYTMQIRSDPIPNWHKRLQSLVSEKDEHVALKKYCEFMKQTEKIRGQIHEMADGVDAEIERQIDQARGN